VAFDLVRDSIWCEGVGVGVGARGVSTWAGGDYLRGALGWERRAKLRTTNKARSHTHTQAQATQPLHRGPPTPIPTAFQQVMGPARAGFSSERSHVRDSPRLRPWKGTEEFAGKAIPSRGSDEPGPEELGGVLNW